MKQVLLNEPVSQNGVNTSNDLEKGFLTFAQNDFPMALSDGLQQAFKPTLLEESNDSTVSLSIQLTFNFSPNITQSVIREGAHGKEKDVLSKRQILMLFDLFADVYGVKRLDLADKRNYKKLARFLHALTGKSTQSFMEEMNHYCHNNLYEWHTMEELDQLIIMTKNLVTIVESGGFAAAAELGNTKIKQMEYKRSKS